jgi:hypothetical protein
MGRAPTDVLTERHKAYRQAQERHQAAVAMPDAPPGREYASGSGGFGEQSPGPSGVS